MNEVSPDNKQIDLGPAEWSSERGSPKEPFFGDGIAPAVVWVVVFVTMSIVFRYLGR